MTTDKEKKVTVFFVESIDEILSKHSIHNQAELITSKKLAYGYSANIIPEIFADILIELSDTFVNIFIGKYFSKLDINYTSFASFRSYIKTDSTKTNSIILGDYIVFNYGGETRIERSDNTDENFIEKLG